MAFDLSTAKPASGGFDLSTAKPVEPPEPSAFSKILRQVGLTARAGIEGIAGIPAMATDAVGNLAIGAYNKLQSPTLSGLVTGDNGQLPMLNTGAALSRNLTRLGLPEPGNATERVVGNAASTLTGAGGVVKGGQILAKSLSPVVAGVGETLSAGPKLQLASAASGSAAQGTAKEGGAGVGGQTAAALGGALLPAAGTLAASAALRGLARGGEEGRLNTLARIKTFEDAGASPSAGQATGSKLVQTIESGLSKIPGSADVMAKAGEKQAAQMGAKVGDIADSLSPNATATKAGLTIDSGIKNFVDRFKGEQTTLYDKLDQYIPKDTRVDVSETKNLLAKLNEDIPGAPNTSKFFKNSKIQSIEGAIKADTETPDGVLSQLGPIQRALLDQVPAAQRTAIAAEFMDGKLPFEALKKMRTLVGNEISDANLASDVPRSKWKALYGALSADMGAAAESAGPEATQAFSRANSYTAAGHQRIEQYLDRIAGKDTVEKVFQSAVSPSEMQQGGSTINAVMRSLKPEERKIVQAAVLKRMGLATPGNQNDLGDTFSAQTFLTNWNKISPEARLTLFADKTGELKKAVETVAKAGNMVKEGSKVFANPSGTSQSAANVGLLTALGGALGTGHLGTALLLGGGVASARGGALTLTNPRFSKWLAEQTTLLPGIAPSQVNALSRISPQSRE